MKIPGIQKNVSLAQHSSWLVGGPAEYFYEPKNVSELAAALKVAGKIPITILGGGTNVLISDKGVRGLVISLSRLTGIEILEDKEHLKLWALAGTAKSELLKVLLKYKLDPAAFLAGLPGQVGGGVVMNAGVGEKLTPREFHEITESVEVLRPNGELKIIDAKNLQWDYRHCEGWRPGIITRVKFSWPNKPNSEILNVVRTLNQTRLHKQPLESPNCGSVFRNPLPQHSGKLIEDLGLKGHTIGGAQISMKHANFIINKGGATSKDIKALMDLCVAQVKEKYGIDLQSEVVWIGEFT
jgi:UDP-N-acetylmuramate dehydrogenase